MARGDQLSRQWRLIRFLDHPNGFTVDEAARELGCTVRTVWRDLAVLQKASFPLYDDKDGRRVRYRLVDGFRAKLPAPFTLSEVVALLMSRDLLAPTSGSVLAPSVHAAFAKIPLKGMRAVIGVRARRETASRSKWRKDRSREEGGKCGRREPSSNRL